MQLVLVQTGAVIGGGGLGSLLSGNMNTHARIADQTITAAASILSPAQVQLLQQLQQEQGK
jgi:hypothetical protein